MATPTPPSSYCRPHGINEIRELEPTPDGWIRGEPTGRTTVVCPCGLNTGWIPSAEAMGHIDQHLQHHHRNIKDRAQAGAPRAS